MPVSLPSPSRSLSQSGHYSPAQLKQINYRPSFMFVPGPLRDHPETRIAVQEALKEGREAGPSGQFTPQGGITSDKPIYTSPAYRCSILVLSQQGGPATKYHLIPNDDNLDYAADTLPDTIASFLSSKPGKKHITVLGGLDDNSVWAVDSIGLYQGIRRAIRQGQQIAKKTVPISTLWGHIEGYLGTEALYSPSRNRFYLSTKPWVIEELAALGRKSKFPAAEIYTRRSAKGLRRTFSTIELSPSSPVQVLTASSAQRRKHRPRPIPVATPKCPRRKVWLG